MLTASMLTALDPIADAVLGDLDLAAAAHAVGSAFPSMFATLTLDEHRACVNHVEDVTGLERRDCIRIVSTIASIAQLDRIGYTLRRF